jgi:hypothetical protein
VNVHPGKIIKLVNRMLGWERNHNAYGVKTEISANGSKSPVLNV